MAKKKVTKKRAAKKAPKKKSSQPSISQLKKKYKYREKTAAEIAAETPWETLVKFGTDPESMKELARLVNTMRQGYNRRIAMFERRGIFSYAAESAKKSTIKNVPASEIVAAVMRDSTVERKYKAATARNALLSEFSKYQEFFQSETASLEGIALVNAEQDRRIFKGSRQKKTMTKNEREDFWSTYEEFLDDPNIVRTAFMSSEYIQQYLASAMFTPKAPVESSEEREKNIAQEESFGITRLYESYEPGTTLYNRYLAYYNLRRAELDQMLGRAERYEPDSPIYTGRGNIK